MNQPVAAPGDLQEWLDRQLIASRDRMAACVSATQVARERPEFFQTITPTRGSVLAAMSVGAQTRPDYFFHWLRDSAIVMAAFEMLRRMGALGGVADPFPDFIAFSAGLAVLDGRALVREGRLGRTDDPGLRRFLRSAAELETVHGDNARGDVRFNPDGTLDVIYWARPQFDGPALRAMLLTARAIAAVGGPQERELLLGDLDYLARVCHEPCFDLWEERFGHHYHTRLVMLSALEAGGAWRAGRGEANAAMLYRRIANELRAALDTHWSDADGFYLASSRAGAATPRDLDAAVILAIAQARLGSGPHSVLDPRAQATLLKLEHLFEASFPLNRDRSAGLGVLHGRFPDDGYYGGGAFPLTTCAAAAFHYRIAAALRAGSVLARREENAAFLARCGVAAGEPEVDTARKFIARGDAILAALRRVAPADGSLPEQFDKTSGAPASAPDLPMSHAAFILACNARRLAAG